MKIIQRYKEISMHRKNFDIVTNNIHYPIASFLCTLISFSRITPNMVTVIAILAELEWWQQTGRDTLAASVAHRAQPSTAAGAG